MKEIKLNSPYAWFLAARPKTLTGAIIPVLLGSTLAFSDGEFKTLPALLCALFACGKLPQISSMTFSTFRKAPTVKIVWVRHVLAPKAGLLREP